MSREAFEAWIKRDSTLSVERAGDGYADMDVYLMWRVWPVAQADAFERAVKVCKTHAEDTSPPQKQYEDYTDGWLDACNEVKWEIEALAKEST